MQVSLVHTQSTHHQLVFLHRSYCIIMPTATLHIQLTSVSWTVVHQIWQLFWLSFPTIWNKLLLETRLSSVTDNFKYHLKTHLFTKPNHTLTAMLIAHLVPQIQLQLLAYLQNLISSSLVYNILLFQFSQKITHNYLELHCLQTNRRTHGSENSTSSTMAELTIQQSSIITTHTYLPLNFSTKCWSSMIYNNGDISIHSSIEQHRRLSIFHFKSSANNNTSN